MSPVGRWPIAPLPALLLSLLLALLAACSAAGDDESSTNAPVDPVAAVRTAPVESRALSSTLTSWGSVGYASQALHSIDSAAEVRVDQVLVVPGQRVSKGQSLITLRPSAASTLELQRARIDWAAAVDALNRSERLQRQQLATNAELAQAQQVANSARATLDAATRRTPKDAGGTLRADSAATVISVAVSRGDLVPADTTLLQLASDGQLLVRASIQPSDVARLRIGQRVQLRTSYAAPDSPSVRGQVSDIDSTIDVSSGLAQAIVKLDNSGLGASELDNGALDISKGTSLSAGARVQALIELERHAGALAVPRSAVLWDSDHAYVFVVDGNIAARRIIETGITDGDWIEVAVGLQRGDSVVVEGNHELVDGMHVSLLNGTPANGTPAP